MCTVTFIARRNGYLLGMNRDEKLSRAVGMPPQITHREGRAILSPSEPGGGTWIGVNDAGVTLALINWYSIPSRAVGKAFSRGEVVRSALLSDSPVALGAALEVLPLNRVNPFRLIAVFPGDKAVVEWRWDRTSLGPREHSWKAGVWISSGFDESGAQQTRGKVFEESLRQTSSHGTDWLRRLHRSHRPRTRTLLRLHASRRRRDSQLHRGDGVPSGGQAVVYARRSLLHRAALRSTPSFACCFRGSFFNLSSFCIDRESCEPVSFNK